MPKLPTPEALNFNDVIARCCLHFSDLPEKLCCGLVAPSTKTRGSPAASGTLPPGLKHASGKFTSRTRISRSAEQNSE